MHADQYKKSSIFETKKYDLRKTAFSDKKSGTLFDSFKVKQNVVSQVTNLFKKFRDDKASELSGSTLENMKSYFDQNPEALEEVSAGKVPEYWNQENTAKRIFSIALMGLKEGMTREEFYENAKGMIDQAYGEVHGMLGFDFPQLVLDTKEAVLNGLEQFRDGTEAEDISFAYKREVDA